jgi:hypothetical protein
MKIGEKWGGCTQSFSPTPRLKSDFTRYQHPGRFLVSLVATLDMDFLFLNDNLGANKSGGELVATGRKC